MIVVGVPAGRHDAGPEAHLMALDALLFERRNIGDRRRAPVGGNREAAQLAVPDEGRDRGNDDGEDLRLSGERRLHGWQGALKRDIEDVEAVGQLEQPLGI